MHRIFQLMIANPQLVNSTLKDNNCNVLFTDVFRNIFQEDGNINVKSYLWAISTSFDFYEHEIRIHQNTRIQVAVLFQRFQLDPFAEGNYFAYKFLLYLNKMYWLLGRKGYNVQERNENIFQFFNDFDIRNVKVVIVANEPSPSCPSSGRAFHLSPCSSTSNILQFLNQEMQFVQNNFRGGEPLVLSQQELESCDLQGWINQGVLLLNSRLTRKTPQWDAFSDYLVDHISQSRHHVVFVLMGRVAGQKLRLINQNHHQVIQVHHPSYYLHETAKRGDAWDWNIVLPFLSINFYLFQVDPSSLIDWSNLNGSKQGGTHRMGTMYKFYQFVLSQSVFLNQYNRYTTINFAGKPLCNVEMIPNGRLVLTNV